MDLVLENDEVALVCEMKIAAKEDYGQYKSYREYFENRGIKVWVVGILNSAQPDELLDAATNKRVTWAQLWQLLNDCERASEPGLKKALIGLRMALEREGVQLNEETAWRVGSRPASINDEKLDLKALPGNARAMTHLFGEVISIWQTEISYDVMKTGNTPIYLRMGWKTWSAKFEQPSCERLIVGLNFPSKRKVVEPIFYFQSEFYNRAFINNFSAFQRTWAKGSSRFEKLGYVSRGDVVRRSSWSHTVNFEERPAYVRPPKFCYMEHVQFSSDLSERIYLKLGWAGLVEELRRRILIMKSHLDALDV